MNFSGKICAVEQFSMSGTKVKAKFDVSDITKTFHELLCERLGKKGLFLEDFRPDGKQEIVIQGRFMQINAGNRLLRYLLPLFGVGPGSAILELEGKLVVESIPIEDLRVKTTNGMGFFGGDSEGLLKGCAKLAAKKMAKQVIKALEKQ